MRARGAPKGGLDRAEGSKGVDRIVQAVQLQGPRVPRLCGDSDSLCWPQLCPRCHHPVVMRRIQFVPRAPPGELPRQGWK